MAKMIRHDYGAIHDALNKMILAEVKAALELVPGKCISVDAWKGESLCRIVVSGVDDYQPVDASVTKAWLADAGKISIIATVDGVSGLFTEDETDWLNITDFAYLINQIAEQVEGDKTYNLPNKSLLTAGYVTELSLKQAMEELVTV